jgi:pyruvate carboxylase
LKQQVSCLQNKGVENECRGSHNVGILAFPEAFQLSEERMVVTSHKHISKILIANRGEIAARVIRTCNRLGIKTVVIYSESDKRHPYLREATECVSLGNESEASKTYLNQEKIISAALDTHCQAIHPGIFLLLNNC